MGAENRQQEKTLFAAATDLPPSERLAFLEVQCGGDIALRAAVEALLQNHERAEAASFLTETFVIKAPWIQEEILPRLDPFDDFEQIEYLGHGATGVVYTAYDKVLQTHVALKLARNAGEQFLDEPRKLARLRHAHIVQIFKIGEHDGRGYFTMNLVKGQGLDQHLARYQANPRAAAQLMVKVARAVDYAHQCNISHRDLKPANILLDERGEPLVTDFSLAIELIEKHLTAPKVMTGIVGTIGYLAPEQAMPSNTVSTAGDVYGLGAVLYALLTGQPPFRGTNVQETLQKVRDSHLRPTLPRVLNPRVDLDLQAICMKCLSKEPAARYHNAEDLAADLERWLANEPMRGAYWPPAYRLWRWCSRNSLVIMMTLATLAILAMLDLSNAFALLSERERQVLNGNENTARSVAGTFRARLQLLSMAVVREAGNEELRAHLKGPHNPARLETLIQRASRFHADPANGLTRNGEADPFASWFLLDGDGIVLAHSSNGPAIEMRSLAFRDYFKRAKELKEPGAAYVSRVYRSDVTDQLYKFAIAVPVRDGERMLGVLVATVMTGSARNALLPDGASQEAVLVGRWDGAEPTLPDPRIPTNIHPDGQRLILLHPAFQRGDTAVEIHNDVLFAEHAGSQHVSMRDGSYFDPVEAKDRAYAGRWLAACMPVERTEFAVIVKQRYDDAVQPFALVGRPLVLWGVIAGALCVGAVAMFTSVIARRRRIV